MPIDKRSGTSVTGSGCSSAGRARRAGGGGTAAAQPRGRVRGDRAVPGAGVGRPAGRAAADGGLAHHPTRSPHRRRVEGAPRRRVPVRRVRPYFGGTLGVVLLAVLGIALVDDLQRINGLKSILSLVINTVAAGVFVFSAHIDWSIAILMGVGSLAGGRLGAGAARRLGERQLRIVVVTFATVVGLVLLAEELTRGRQGASRVTGRAEPGRAAPGPTPERSAHPRPPSIPPRRGATPAPRSRWSPGWRAPAGGAARGRVVLETVRASSIHPIARPWRSGSGPRSKGSASSDRRSIVRCCASVSRIMAVKRLDDGVEPPGRVLGGSAGSIEVGSDLGVRGEQQRPLVGK